MKIKSAKSYGQKVRTTVTIYMVVWLLSTAFIVHNFAEMVPFHPGWLGLATFVVMVGAALRACKNRREPFKCRDCGEVVENSLENSGASSEAIIFHCTKCDVLWHVGNTVDS